MAACREQIVHNLSEIDSTRMVTQLSSRGVVATREKQTDGRWTVSVDSTDTKLALKLIDSRRLLHDDRQPLDDRSSVLASREEQRFKFERSLSREIEGTLGALDGVLDARVHLNLPPMDPLFGQPLSQNKGSASVLIIVGAEFKAQSSEVASIISGASGVPLDNVSVLLSHSSDEEVLAPQIEPTKAQLTAFPDERLIEGGVSCLILLGGLFAMRRAFQSRRGKVNFRLGEAATTLQTETAYDS